MEMKYLSELKHKKALTNSGRRKFVELLLVYAMKFICQLFVLKIVTISVIKQIQKKALISVFFKYIKKQSNHCPVNLMGLPLDWWLTRDLNPRPLD